MRLAAVFALAVALAIQAAGTVSAQQAQPPQVQTQTQVQGQAQTPAQGNVQTTGQMTFGGITQTPWFSNPTARTQVNLTDAQFNALSTAYGQAWTKFQTGL